MPRRRRRVGRIILNGLTGVSLLLCLATVGLWVLTHNRYLMVRVSRDQLAGGGYPSPVRYRFVMVESSGGELGIYTGLFDDWPSNDPLKTSWSVITDLQPRRLEIADHLPDGGWLARMHAQRIGVAFRSLDEDQRVGWSLWLPHAGVALAFGVLPAIRWLPRLIAKRRAPHHLCLHCRYDLTGNVSGVCPECGTAVVVAAVAADAHRPPG